MKINYNLIPKAKQWQHLFNEIPDIAMETGFVKRISKVNGKNFLKTILQAQAEYSEPTLDDYCLTFEDYGGSTISKNGFHKRINTKTIAFLKDFLNKVLEINMKKMTKIPNLLKSFTEVSLLDSSQLELPECLSDIYKGSSGCASASAIKIQFLYEFLSGKSKHFEIMSGATPDQSYGPEIATHLKKGSLALFDLGYVTSDCLDSMISKGIYYVCRFPHYLFKVYHPDDSESEIDLLSILNENQNCNVELTAFVGPKKIPARIVAYQVPREVFKKRKATAIKNAKRKKRTVSERHLSFLKWSIYITNAPEELIKSKDVITIYRLRWQIELVFKLWKSLLALEHLAGKRKERIEFEIYSKLILFSLYCLSNEFVKGICSDEVVEQNHVASLKCFKKILPKALKCIDKPKGLHYQLVAYSSKVYDRGRKSKSTNKKTVFELLNNHSKGGRVILKVNSIDIRQLCSQYAMTHLAEIIYRKGT